MKTFALYNLQVCDTLINLTHLFKQQQKRLCFKMQNHPLMFVFVPF